jgi:hypothetical protein
MPSEWVNVTFMGFRLKVGWESKEKKRWRIKSESSKGTFIMMKVPGKNT